MTVAFLLLRGLKEMAARIKLRHTPDVREKIKTSQLINRLQNCALGKVDLDSNRIKAIEILLRKTIPDLKAIEHSGEIKAQIREVREVLIDPRGADTQGISAAA
jgi:hypothetical protein